MSMPERAELRPLLDALTWYDEDSRQARAERIEWASSLYQSSGIVAGEIVPLSLMEEARVCFVNGQFMASVLCATSVVEHLLVGKLTPMDRGTIKGKPMLGNSIEVASTKKLFPAEIIGRVKKLNGLRNPLAHRREPQDESTFANRYLNHKMHPDYLKKKDACFALEVMYEFFQLILKSDD